MKHLFSILIFLIVSQLAVSQNTILWKVTDDISNKTSFLVGTYHQFGNSFVDSIPEIRASLLKSELAVFESIDAIESTRNLINSRQASLQVEKKLKRKDFKKLKAIAKDWKVDLYKLKPLEIRWKLQQEFQKVKCKTIKPTDKFDHFDNYLKAIAEENNIALLGLETDSLQLELIALEYKNPNWKQEKKNIGFWVDQLTSNNPNMEPCKFADKYRAFDLDYDFDNACETDVIIFKRNNKWMETIPNLLRVKNTFIAVGYAHLVKKCGLIEQLRAQGFKVEQVNIKPVTN